MKPELSGTRGGLGREAPDHLAVLRRVLIDTEGLGGIVLQREPRCEGKALVQHHGAMNPVHAEVQDRFAARRLPRHKIAAVTQHQAVRFDHTWRGIRRSVDDAQTEWSSQRLNDCIRHVRTQGDGRTGAHDLAETCQYGLGIGLGPRRVTGSQPRQQPITQILQRASMAQSRLVAGGAGCDFQRFNAGFLSRLQSLGRWRLKPPIPPAILGIRSRDIGEGGVQRFGHPLRRAVRNAEFGTDVLKANAATPRSGHLGETE